LENGCHRNPVARRVGDGPESGHFALMRGGFGARSGAGHGQDVERATGCAPDR